MRLTDLKLTLLFDNVACDPRLQCLWGFACLVELPGLRLLFDTGSNGRILLRNMRTLGIEPTELNFLFISHSHWDHIGGLDSILELNPGLHLVIPASLSPRMVDNLRILCREVTVVGEDPEIFAPGLASTGTLPGDPPEQALVIESNAGPVAITGCAHPGIATIAATAIRQTGAPLSLLAGGFHLFEASPDMVDQVAEQLAALDVRYILPTHCTGTPAMRRLEEQFGQQFLQGGSGQVVVFDAENRPFCYEP